MRTRKVSCTRPTTTQAEARSDLNRQLLGAAFDLKRQLDALTSQRTAALGAVEDLVVQLAGAGRAVTGRV